MKFSPPPNLARARLLLEFADRAYAESTVRDELTGTDVLITRHDGATIVAFRGSSEIRDWLVNAQFGFWSDKYGRVHRGFVFAWASVAAKVIESVGPHDAVYLTGHSLGGALALIAARDLVKNLVYPTAVVTFGAPRVGDAAWCRDYDAILGGRTDQFVAQGDPVPLVPPLLSGYRDCGHERYLTDGGRLLTDPWIGAELFSDALGVFARWRRGREALLHNHSLAHYRELLAHLDPATTTRPLAA